ncbi:hypothetical protein BDZ94DRAFT_1246111 [Collybia nuda]|uniref:DUF6534 domain-containing protein n=1 Tax=Collybia nuda TaxID=64659 RepID=A0A9P5YEX8_9AGAR|nr:hypothetical protein BDZ94DRAFT_1246111 [Collybia nuda]
MEPPPPSIRSSPGTLDGTLGALLVCVLIAVALFGVICLQTYQYFSYYVKDKLYIKILVGTIWCLEFTHTVVIVQALYNVVVTNFGTPSFITNQPITLNISVIFSGLINTGVQGFFAYRIKLISKRWLVPIICWSLLAVRLTCAIASSAVVIRVQIVGVTTNYKWLLTLLLVATAVGDLVVAVALAYFLSKGRRGFLQTTRVINYLILFSIETGVITSLIAIAVLIIFLTKPSSYAWIGMLLFLAKVYTNSLLLSLNNRKNLRSDFVGYNDSEQLDSRPYRSRGITIEMSPMTIAAPSPIDRKDTGHVSEENASGQHSAC